MATLLFSNLSNKISNSNYLNIKMKKIYILPVLALGMLAAACGGGKNGENAKPTPEEEVRAYAKYFVAQLDSNRLDSIKVTYPDIALADSIAPLKSDTIIVAQAAPGQYNVTLAEGVTLKATRGADGKISVTESRGLFYFPADKVELAKKTGMWNDSISDRQLSERLKDEDFFKYVTKSNKAKLSKMLVIGKWPELYGGNQTVTNKSDKTIDGSDYSVVKSFTTRGDYFSRGGVSYSTIKGKTLKPGASMSEYVNVAPMGAERLERIKWNMSDEELIAKYVTFTGKEYDDYLKTKK